MEVAVGTPLWVIQMQHSVNLIFVDHLLGGILYASQQSTATAVQLAEKDTSTGTIMPLLAMVCLLGVLSYRLRNLAGENSVL